MANIRAGLVLFVFFVAISCAFVWQGVSVYFKCRRRKTFPPKFHHFWCRLFGIRVIRIGEPVKADGLLIVANHTSYLDIPILGSTTPMSFIARHDVARWPIVGIMVNLQESVLVERKRRDKTGLQRDAIRERLEEGDTIAIFAEGTTSDNNRVLPFKTSLFGAAVGKTAEDKIFLVQPVSITYAGLHGMPISRGDRHYFAWTGDSTLVPHIWEMVKAGPLDVVVEFHPPIAAAGGDRKGASQAAEAAVRQGWIDGPKRWRGAA
jgi:lyso-ornithine lipid O-acyltransferase